MRTVMLMMALLFSTSAFSKVYLRSCYDYQRDGGVSYSYQSCINQNFRDIDKELGVFLSGCHNYGDRVSYSFSSCIQRNFSRIGYKLTELYLSYCSNYRDDRLSSSFTSCANRNFRAIQRVINEL